MSDVVVTLPLNFTWPGAPRRKGLAAWLMEGDPAGEAPSGVDYYAFYIGGARPRIEPGERVYVVYSQRLIGYAPLIRIKMIKPSIGVPCGVGRHALIRGGGAVAVTIEEAIPGFRGWRYRWWDRSAERPIGNWPEIVAAARANEPLLPPIRMEASP